MNRLLNISLLAKSLMPLAVVLYLLATDPNVLADTSGDYGISAQNEEVLISPVSFSYDDTIIITLRGLPSDFPLPSGSVSLGDTPVQILGQGKDLKARPKSDSDGTLTFSTQVPENVRSGSQYLTVYIKNIFDSQAEVDVRPISLRVSSNTVVPYQDVWVMGRGFKARSDKNMPTYAINESQPTGVTIGNHRVLTPFVDFPTRLGDDGSVFFKLTIPELYVTSIPGKVELRVTDSSGRIGTAELTVPQSTWSAIPASSYPGQRLRFVLAGLMASNPTFNTVNHVDINFRYALDSSGNRFSSIPIGRYTTDATGRISGNLEVPKSSLISSTNYIDITPSYGVGRSFVHKLADRAISIEPKSGFPGQTVSITLKGMPANYKLGLHAVLIGGKQLILSDGSDSRMSDEIGQLTFNSIVPSGIPNGLNVVVWGASGGAKVKTIFTVNEGTLKFDTGSAVPGQVLNITSGGFVGAFGDQSTAQNTIRITGSGDSWVWLDGVKLKHDVIDYPIMVDKNEPFEFDVRIPVDSVTAAKRSLQFLTVDTAGRSSKGTLPMKSATITITPKNTARNLDVTVNGTGFVANSDLKARAHKVLVEYAGILVGTVRIDSEGSFSHKFAVPSSVSANSTYRVTAVVKDVPSIKAISTHTVPNSAITVSPAFAKPGEDVRITGSGLNAYRQVTIGFGRLWVLGQSKLYTDEAGAFDRVVTVPLGLDSGKVEVSVYASYPTLSKRTTFRVD